MTGSASVTARRMQRSSFYPEIAHSCTVASGDVSCSSSAISNASLDAAMRPNLVGGATVLATAIVAAGNRVDVTALTRYAQELAWAAALRRIGSIADALEVEGLAGRLQPLKPPTADLDLEPGANKPRVWRDARWRMRWPQSVAEIASVAKQ